MSLDRMPTLNLAVRFGSWPPLSQRVSTIYPKILRIARRVAPCSNSVAELHSDARQSHGRLQSDRRGNLALCMQSPRQRHGTAEKCYELATVHCPVPTVLRKK